ncbi:MAG: Ig-like domain-containing protein [Gemmatimonadaceae bacterium]|nr:Ig-like domain-containing protein [Gemmatimonadaceae bacterium]
MPTIPLPARRSLLTLLLVSSGLGGVTACSGGDGGTPPPPPPTPTVNSVTVTPSAATIRVGETQSLNAVVDVSNGAGTGISWSSEQPSVASVSASGVVTGLSTGTAVIRATSTVNAQRSGSATITVQAARTLTVSPATANIGVGQTAALTVSIQLDPGLPTTVIWRSAATNIATVNANGVVTGVALGSTQITAISTADTLLRASTTVNVVPSVRSVSVTPTTATLNINDTRAFTATVTADAGVSQAVTWRSGNLAVATVNASGVVTAVGVGSTTITALATADTLRRATAALTVAPRITSVSIQQRAVSVNPGTSTTLTAVVTADPGVNTTLAWTSSAPAVASVNEQGVVTGLSSGTTLITAALQNDPTRRDTVTVSVVPRLAGFWRASRLGGALYEDILAVYAVDANTAYAVNSVGDVYRWNGNAWTVSTTGAAFNTQFYAVHGSGANDIVAVGRGGRIARFNGSNWSAMTSGTTRDLFGVYVESGGQAWAVGAAGVVLQLSGGTWTSQNSGATLDLNAVWAGDNTVYVVGNDGEVRRRIGGGWSRMEVPTAEGLYGVHGLSAVDVVVVGLEGTVLRWNGAVWTVVSAASLPGSFYGVVGSGANGGRRYLVGDGGVAQLDDLTLTAVNTPYAPAMYGISLDNTGTVWAGGQRGAVLRGLATWTTLNLAPDLLDVWSTAANNSFAVGEFGFVYRWNGSSWTRLVTPTQETLNAVWAVSASDAFVGGDNGTMLRWNGTSFSTMSFPSGGNVFSLWGSAANNVYATTDRGEVLRWNGTAWSVVTTASSSLWSVFGANASSVMVGGENGTVLRFNGSAWSTVTSPGNGTITGLWLTGLSDVYAVGADGTGAAAAAFGFNGSTWRSINTGTSSVLTSVWGPSVNDLYATGDRGTLLRFNGSSWSALSSGSSDLLWSVSGAPDASGGAFAVGYNSTVVAGSNTAFRSGVMAVTAPLTGMRVLLEPDRGARLRRGPLPAHQPRLSLRAAPRADAAALRRPAGPPRM